jgi:hypothetical protein
VSTWDPRKETKTTHPELAEREAVRLLRGVGGDTEWWIYKRTRTGHFRVALTADEYAQMPPGCAIHDAGESGPARPRTKK